MMNYMKAKAVIFILGLLLIPVSSCKEVMRYEVNEDDSVPPGKPENITYTPLYGGARFHYSVPGDEDLLSIDAVYTNSQGQSFWFSASYYSDSLDVYGFGSMEEHTVQLYAVDRAGNRSEVVTVSVTPLEPAITRVEKSVIVKPGFSSFFLDWENELEQSINVYVDFDFTQNGEKREISTVFSSNFLTDRRFIRDVFLSPDIPINIKIRVEDRYGNITQSIDMGNINLYEDTKIPKENWVMPPTGDSIGGVPQFFGDGYEGRVAYLIDDIIDKNDNRNFIHTAYRGRTGKSADGGMPWNAIIDLGDYYDLSRIITTQRHDRANSYEKGQYYAAENVGLYNMYIWDDDLQDWEFVSQHKIPIPVGMSEIEIVRQAEAGDMAYMYPDDPKYTKPTRWFRYEALKCFDGDYTSDSGVCLSELTLYGRKSR
jgi:hypothetical protein